METQLKLVTVSVLSVFVSICLYLSLPAAVVA